MYDELLFHLTFILDANLANVDSLNNVRQMYALSDLALESEILNCPNWILSLEMKKVQDAMESI